MVCEYDAGRRTDDDLNKPSGISHISFILPTSFLSCQFIPPLVVHPKLPRSHSHKLLKRPREVALIVIADLKTNLRAVLVGRQEQLLGAVDANARKIIDKRDIHLLLENVRQP